MLVGSERWLRLGEWAMLVPELHCAVHCYSTILVKKKPDDTCPHIHTAAASTWSHVGRVEKISYPTPKQAPKNVATTKSNRPQLQSRGNSKTATPT